VLNNNNNRNSPPQTVTMKKQVLTLKVPTLTPPQTSALKRKRKDSLTLLRNHKKQRNDPTQQFSALDLYLPV
jgi:hypothetical protein